MDRDQYISITAKIGWGDCEDCGSFSHGTAIFQLDGEDVLEVHHDGHFGGDWDGEKPSLHRYALGLAGVAPRINGELPEGIPLAESGSVDDWGNRLRVPVHELGDWEFVDIELVHLGDDPHYPTPVRATWVGGDGLPAQFVFDQANPEWGPFWEEFCHSMVVVDLDWSDSYGADAYGDFDD